MRILFKLPVSGLEEKNKSIRVFPMAKKKPREQPAIARFCVFIILIATVFVLLMHSVVHEVKSPDNLLATIHERVQIPGNFTHEKVVVLVAYDRFQYFRKVVNSLIKAHGSQAYTVLIFVDGPPNKSTPSNRQRFNKTGWENIIEYAKQLQFLAENHIGFKSVQLHTSQTNIGLHKNKKLAVQHAFQLTDFVIILEDDVVIEADGLTWFEWHVTSGIIFRDSKLALATCWSNFFPYHTEHVEAYDLMAVQTLQLLDKYYLNPWATPWGWATWRRTWDEIGNTWSGWAIELGNTIREKGWHESQPAVARCNNVGRLGFSKKGATIGHIHERAITSASFPVHHACSFTEILPQWNPYSYVRHGMGLVMLNETLPQYQKLLEHRWNKMHAAGVEKSSC